MLNLPFRIGIITHITFLVILSSVNKAYGSTTKTVGEQSSSEPKLDRHRIDSKVNLIAQTDRPNRDRFLQPDLEQISPEDRESEPILPQEKPTVIPEPDVEGEDINIPVSKIEVKGSTVFTEQELNSITEPLEGKTVKLSQLRNAAKAITQKYLEQGYITSRAIVPQQEIEDGIVEIKVIEGSIADIQIEGNNRLRENFVRKRLELGADTPVKVDDLEGQLQLLRSNQAIENIEANIQPAPGEGESSLVVEIDEASPWLIGGEINNYDTVATGAEKASLTLGYRNLTGNSDSLVGVFSKALSTSSWSLDTSYSLPVNAKDGTLQLRTNIDRNEIVTDEFEDLDLEAILLV